MGPCDGKSQASWRSSSVKNGVPQNIVETCHSLNYDIYHYILIFVYYSALNFLNKKKPNDNIIINQYCYYKAVVKNV